MPVKTTGAEWKRFYNDKDFWPEGWWHDDEVLEIDGKVYADGIFDGKCDSVFRLDSIPDQMPVKILSGVVFRGTGDHDGVSLVSHFNRWRKQQTHVGFTVYCPKDKLDAVKEAVKAAGGRVLS